MASRFFFAGDPPAGSRFSRFLLTEAEREKLARAAHLIWTASDGQVSMLGPGGDARNPVRFELLLADLRECGARADVPKHLAGELRRVAHFLLCLAMRVEGGRDE